MTARAILVLNAGSSSLKFCLFQADEQLTRSAQGRIVGLGGRPQLYGGGQLIREFPGHLDPSSAVREIWTWIEQHQGPVELAAVGHRIVHGGEKYTAATRLTPQVLYDLEQLTVLAPLHQTYNLAAVRAVSEVYPQALQVGCFDTSFHAGHTAVFRHFALPKYLRDAGLRRYGFHGLSYEWIANVLPQQYPQFARGRVVVAHLGNGASVCALRECRSIDTSMGMSALDGLPMGTRCGNLDPGVLLYMLRNLHWDADRIERVLSYESGLLGLSGLSHDMRVLLASETAEAEFAVDFFCWMTAQHIARMAVSLGGLDALVFTGGIGENAAPVRQRVVKYLEFLFPFEVLVIEANEEQVIAQHCWSLIQDEALRR